EIEKWLQSLRRDKKLANPTLDKLRRVMSLAYTHAQRYGLLHRGQACNPMRCVRCKPTSDYETILLTPGQPIPILCCLTDPKRTLTLLASTTGLRISKCLGLQWHDVDFENQRIHVRRTWVHGRIAEPKSRASRASVPLHSLLAESIERWRQSSPYSQP